MYSLRGMHAASKSDSFGTTINTRHSECLFEYTEVQEMVKHCSGATAYSIYLATGSRRDFVVNKNVMRFHGVADT